MEKLIKVAVNDFRLVFRDNSLKIFIVLPLLTLVFACYGLPYIAGIYEVVREYIPLILMMATLQGATAFGFIYSMVLVDEKDTGVAKVYGILPLSQFLFVAFRLIPPFVLAAFSTFCLLLVEPFYGFPIIPALVYSILAGLTAPVMTLFVATLAGNKIEAMTWQKLFTLPLYLPVVSLFIASPFSFLFAVLPAFWVYQVFDALIDNRTFWPFALGGFVHAFLLIAFMIRTFTERHFR